MAPILAEYPDLITVFEPGRIKQAGDIARHLPVITGKADIAFVLQFLLGELGGKAALVGGDIKNVRVDAMLFLEVPLGLSGC